MSAANQESQPYHSATPPFRQGALDATEIRRECPQFRILVIGKANAGKTTILRKVCNAKPDMKPVIYDAKGKKLRQDPTKVRRGDRVLFTRNDRNFGSL
jgi:septin family protein